MSAAIRTESEEDTARRAGWYADLVHGSGAAAGLADDVRAVLRAATRHGALAVGRPLLAAEREQRRRNEQQRIAAEQEAARRRSEAERRRRATARAVEERCERNRLAWKRYRRALLVVKVFSVAVVVFVISVIAVYRELAVIAVVAGVLMVVVAGLIALTSAPDRD